MEGLRKNIILLLMLGLVFAAVGLMFGVSSATLLTTATISYTAPTAPVIPDIYATELTGISWNNSKNGFDVSTCAGFSYIASDRYIVVSGTSNNGWLLNNGYSAAELQILVDNNLVKKAGGDKTYNITADITYSIAATTGTNFNTNFNTVAPSILAKGVVEGGNHKLTRFPIRKVLSTSSNASALFNENAGTIQNLEVDSSKLTSGNSSNVGVVCHTNNGTIKNVVTSDSLNAASITNVGFGGIVYKSTNLIDSCVNNISTNSPAGGVSAGIVYEAGGTISNCTNNGRVDTIAGAGIVYQTSGSLVITGCSNNGDIVVGGSLGGIISIAEHSIEVYSCENNAKIDGGNTGGIVGKTSLAAYIEGCTNNYSGSIASYEDGGGIVGWAEGSIEVSSCYNYADVTSEVNSGGIIGKYREVRESYNIIVNDCRNNGKIYSGDRYGDTAGGIVGHIFGFYVYIQVTGCYNYEEIACVFNNRGVPTPSGSVGGIVGFIGGIENDIYVAGNTNSGSIFGYYSGWIVGNPQMDSN